MKKFIFPVSFLFLVSCSKENSIPYTTEDAPDNEYFIEQFTDYTYRLNLTVTGYTTQDEPKIYQQHDYRLASGEQVDGKYFYKILRKSNFDYQVGTHSHDWLEMDGLYRYNFNEKKAEFYHHSSDQNGLTLMDFNLKPGDVFLVDACSSIDDLNFEVNSTEDVFIGNQAFPVLKGKLIYTSVTSPQSNYESHKEIEVMPFSPSPFMHDLMYINLVGYDWSPESFSEWQGSYCVTTILFSRINHVTGVTEYECTLKDDL